MEDPIFFVHRDVDIPRPPILASDAPNAAAPLYRGVARLTPSVTPFAPSQPLDMLYSDGTYYDPRLLLSLLDIPFLLCASDWQRWLWGTGDESDLSPHGGI